MMRNWGNWEGNGEELGGNVEELGKLGGNWGVLGQLTPPKLVFVVCVCARPSFVPGEREPSW